MSGYALKWFFLLVLGVSLLTYFSVDKLGNTFLKDPKVEGFFEQIPVIEVKNGEIFQKGLDVKLELPDTPFTYFVINTKDNQDVKMDFTTGIYMAQKLIYFKNGASVQVTTYPELFGHENFVLTQDILKSLFTNMLKMMSVLGIILFFSLTYVLLSFFTWMGMFVFGKRMPLKVCARLSFFGVIGVVIFEFLFLFLMGISYFQLLILGSILLECMWLFKNYTTYQRVQDIDEVLLDMQEDLKNNTVLAEKEIEVIENEKSEIKKPKGKKTSTQKKKVSKYSKK